MKLPCRLAESCGRFWDWLIAPSLLFAAVLLAFPAFLFQKNLTVLVGEAITFFFLALSRRGRVRLLSSILMVAGITFFSLFVPHGQVLVRLGKLTVTTGALAAGLRRGVTLAGMVFLSQLAVSPQVRLPGRMGAFVVDMFSLLDQLGRDPLGLGTVGKKGVGSENFSDGKVGKKDMVGVLKALDRHLYQVYWQREDKKGAAIPEENRARRGVVGRGVVTMLVWLAVLYGLLVVGG